VSCQQIYKLLAQMPYTEMEALAEALHGRISGARTPEQLAHALAHAGTDLFDDKSDDGQEAKLTRRIFNRKRTISIAPSGSGYAVTIPTVPGSSVVHTNLRVALGQMLDQAITHEALLGESKNGRR
jgi:hypothetical protein